MADRPFPPGPPPPSEDDTNLVAPVEVEVVPAPAPREAQTTLDYWIENNLGAAPLPLLAAFRYHEHSLGHDSDTASAYAERLTAFFDLPL